MTNAQIISLWNSNRSNLHDISLYNDDAFVNYVPTASGGNTKAELEGFFAKNRSVFDMTDERPQIISQVVQNDQIVEEMVIKFSHKESLEWFLPNVAPSRHIFEVPFVRYSFDLMITGFFSGI
jgi:hypothetical protein